MRRPEEQNDQGGTMDQKDRDLMISTAESAKSAHHRITEVRTDIQQLRNDVRDIPHQVAVKMNGLGEAIHDLSESHSAHLARCTATHKAVADLATVNAARINARAAIRVALIGLVGAALGFLVTVLVG